MPLHRALGRAEASQPSAPAIKLPRRSPGRLRRPKTSHVLVPPGARVTQPARCARGGIGRPCSAVDARGSDGRGDRGPFHLIGR